MTLNYIENILDAYIYSLKGNDTDEVTYNANKSEADKMLNECFEMLAKTTPEMVRLIYLISLERMMLPN